MAEISIIAASDDYLKEVDEVPLRASLEDSKNRNRESIIDF